jgi:nuclear transport factor 2 (NTF2) superfamily protein
MNFWVYGEVMMSSKKIVPPFTAETAVQKVRGAEDAWNSRDVDRVVLGEGVQNSSNDEH